MAQPLQPRRSAREQAPTRSYIDQQSYDRMHEQLAADVQRAVREAAATVEASDSDEKELSYAEHSESEEEKKVPSNKENLPQWTEELHDIHPPVCDATPAVLLPRVNLPLQLDYLQCFMDQVVIDSFVTNTNLYAISRQAVDWVPDTTEEMWRYLAIRIRQGIVVLPDLHYYWQAGYRDSYCAALMSRNRFCQLHRYFHIAPPVPRGQRQTVVEKTHLFYHQCQALFLKSYEPGSNMALDETMIRFQGRSPGSLSSD